jgi:hypothetical protein
MPLRSERRFINLNDVKPGMMVQFTYTKKSGGSGSYTVLVVDPDRTNERATEPQLHGFVIDELTDSQLIEFFTSFGKSINLDYEDRRASVVEGINTDEAYTTFSTSKYVTNRSYRTFNRSSISQVRQILVGSVD